VHGKERTADASDIALELLSIKTIIIRKEKKKTIGELIALGKGKEG
jgi:hypothetical protein